MDDLGPIHTVPFGDTAWLNMIGGRTVTRHQDREDAVAAGDAMAQSLAVEHVIHRGDGEVVAQADYRTTPPG